LEGRGSDDGALPNSQKLCFDKWKTITFVKVEIGAMSLGSTDFTQIRKFGLIAFLLFGFLSGLGLLSEKYIATCFFGSLAVFGIGLVLIPSQLRPFYNAWLKVAHLLHKITTILILTVVFYFVLTPTALIRRLFSGTPLPMKPDNMASSYWISRTEAAQPRERFLTRY
jgi:hypothetical protein